MASLSTARMTANPGTSATAAAPDSAIISPAANWRTALAAAALVQAGCGLLAAAVVDGSGNGHQPVAIFIACSIAAGVTEVALVQGWLWVPGPFALGQVLARTAVAACGLGLAVVAGVMGAFCAAPFAGLLGDGWALHGIFATAFVAAGAVTGLSPFVAARRDARPGVVRAGLAASVTAGVVGVLLVSAIASWSALTYGAPRAPLPHWRLLLGLVPGTLVVAGLVHGAMVAHRHNPSSARLPPSGLVWRRAVACCACCTVLAGALLLIGLSWYPLDGVAE